MNNIKDDLAKSKVNYSGFSGQDFPAQNTEKFGEKSGKKSGDALQKYAIVAVIAFLIGFGAGRIDRGSNDIKVDSKDINATTSDMVRSGGDTVWDRDAGFLGSKESLVAGDVFLVENQPAGLEVFVKKAALPKSAWLAIREDNGKGEPGNILGAQLFDPGMTSGKVELLRNTESGKVYYAMIYSDNGDRAFIPKMDVPVLGADGKPLMIMFRATN